MFQNCHPSPITAASVVARLEEAGRTLFALPQTGPSTRMVQGGMEWIRDASESYGRHRTLLRPAVPSAAEITRMDESYAWIPLIPADKYVIRRIVGARSLMNPMSGRYQYSWRRLGTALGADHKAVQRWHGQGIDMIVAALKAQAPSDAGRPLRPQRESGLPETPGHDRRADT